jgi:hypothetical protein
MRSIRFVEVVAVLLASISFSQVHAEDAPKPIEFYEKFDRQRERHSMTTPVFLKGERIHGTFVIFLEEGQIKLVFENNRIDPDRADVFFLSLKEEEKRFFLEHEGMPIEADLDIAGEGTYLNANIFRYPVKVAEQKLVAPVNASMEELGKLEDGDFFILEGVLKSIDVYSLRLQLPDGRNLQVRLPSGQPTYVGSLSEKIQNISNKELEVGDRIRLVGFIRGGKLAAQRLHSAYLIQANPERQKKYDLLREKIQSKLKTLGALLAEHQFGLARALSAEVLEAEFTAAELRQLDDLFSTIPVDERPVQIRDDWSRKFPLLLTNDQFGVHIDAMTRKELATFIRGFAERRISPIKKMDEGVYLFHLMSSIGVSPKEQIETLETAIRTRLEFFKENSRSGEKYDSGKNWNDEYSMTESYRFLGLTLINPEVVDFMIDLLDEVSLLDSKGGIFDTHISWRFEVPLEESYSNTKSEMAKNRFKERRADLEAIGLRTHVGFIKRLLDSIDCPKK